MVDVVLALAESDCERLRPGWLAQPANALSSLAFVAVGVWLLGRYRRGGGPAVLVAALAMVGVGVGSFAYHGPQPGWAGPTHDMSVVALAVAVGGQTVWFLARGATRFGVIAAWRSGLPWLALGVIAWRAGTSGSSLCDPPAFLQAHAAWHALSAVGLGMLLGRYSPRPGDAVAGAGNCGSRSRPRP